MIVFVFFFVLITLALQVWPEASDLLRFSRPAYEQGAFWQPLASQWVHLSRWHAVGNAFAFAAISFACGFWVRWPVQMLALGGGYIGVAAVVALDPNCTYYAGASGALHGMLAGNGVGMVWATCLSSQLAQPPGETNESAISRLPRLIGITVLAGLALKLWMQTSVTEGAPSTGWGFPVYHPSHVAGALGGMGMVVLLLAARVALAANIKSKARQ